MSDLRVMGSFESGLVIEAEVLSHIAGERCVYRSVILTPAQSSELFRRLVNLAAESKSEVAA